MTVKAYDTQRSATGKQPASGKGAKGEYLLEVKNLKKYFPYSRRGVLTRRRQRQGG